MYSACMINAQLKTMEDPIVEEVLKWGAHFSFFCELKRKIAEKKIVLLDQNHQLVDLKSVELIYDDDVIMVGV